MKNYRCESCLEPRQCKICNAGQPKSQWKTNKEGDVAAISEIVTERPDISCQEDAYAVIQKRPESVRDFFEFISAREKMRDNIESNAKGDAVYEG